MGYSIGLTGGIASGKSTAARILEENGLLRVDADRVARDVVLPGEPALEELKLRFGEQILTPEGTLDRAALGRLVFADTEARRDLEGILHPRIWERLKAALVRAEQERRETVVEIPLLFESGRENDFETIWVVTVPEELQARRLVARDGFTAEEVQQRLASQLPLVEKARRAHLVLDNQGPVEDLEAAIVRALEQWRETRIDP